MVRPCVVLQHVPTEGPERIGPLLEAAGYSIDVCRVFAGESVPRDLAPDAALVVMGGPMGVSDLGDPARSFLADEVALLQTRLAQDAPILGICLGSQLLAHAAGARVYPASRREVGFAPVDFLGAEREPALAGMRARETMLHWHGDTFDLPAGAVCLASTPTCPNQLFRLGRRAFGVQFHPEVTAPTLEEWLRVDADYVVQANGPEGAARIRADAARHFAEYRTVGDRLIANLIACLGAA
jgi:GMP synthase-like glutamine amidotransferase